MKSAEDYYSLHTAGYLGAMTWRELPLEVKRMWEAHWKKIQEVKNGNKQD